MCISSRACEESHLIAGFLQHQVSGSIEAFRWNCISEEFGTAGWCQGVFQDWE